MTAPAGAVAGLLDPARRSSWQLAQEVWQESGVIWERAAPEIADVDPAGGWLADPQPLAFEPQDDDPRPAAFDPAATSAWPAYTEAVGPESDAPDPAGFERAACPWPAEPEPEGGQPADTWFTGVGPADTRFAAARPADSGSVGGEPDAGRGAGPYFADSGVAPMQPESTSQRPGPMRQNRQRPNPTRPEPIAEDLARDDAMRRGSPENPARPGSGRPPRQQRPGPTWNEYPASGFPGQAWPVPRTRAARRAGRAGRAGVRQLDGILQRRRSGRRRLRLGRPGAAARRVR